MNENQHWANDPKLRIVGLCCQALDDKKAENLRILNVSGFSSITDYFIIATGNSEPHLRALTNEAERVLKEENQSVLGRDMNPASGWTVLDAHDVILHLFLPEIRDLYRLDSLWKDGEEIKADAFIELAEPVGLQRGH